MTLGINGSSHVPSNSSSSSHSTASLSKDSLSILRDQFKFSSVRVIDVTPGINHVDGLTVLNELDKVQSQPLLAELASLAEPGTTLDSVVVLIGGLDLIQDGLNELKKSAKNVNKKKISEFLQEIGLSADHDTLFFSDSSVLPGGLLVLSSGLNTIKATIDD